MSSWWSCQKQVVLHTREYLSFFSSNLILTWLFAQVPSFLSTQHLQYTIFSPSQQCCTEWVGEWRPKGLGKRWHRLPTCGSHVQVSLMLSDGGSNTEMLLSVPAIGTSWTALRGLPPVQPSAQTKGGNILSKDRIKNICLKLCIIIELPVNVCKLQFFKDHFYKFAWERQQFHPLPNPTSYHQT